MKKRNYFKFFLSLSMTVYIFGVFIFTEPGIGTSHNSRSQKSQYNLMEEKINTQANFEGNKDKQVQEQRKCGKRINNITTVDHGDTLIEDANESFMDRGFRTYQDMIDVDQGSQLFNTYVNVVYGNLIHFRKDFLIPGRGLPLQIVFTYNSGSLFNGRYGPGWQMNYNLRYVTNTKNENVIIVRPCDRTDLFLKQPDESFKGSYGVRDSLVALPKGYKLIVWRDMWNSNGDYVIYFFDSPEHHYITRMEDQNGNVLIFTYNTDKQLIKVTDVSGRELLFNYTANKLIKITDPNGRDFTYQYDSNGDMVKVTDPIGSTVSYAYTQDCHDCISISDANGNTTRFSYNEDYAVNTVTDPLENKAFSFLYEWLNSGNTRVTDGNGNTTVYTYDEKDRAISITNTLGYTTTQTWDDAYNLTGVTNGNGNTTAYTYDYRGNVLTIKDALGNNTVYTWESTYNKMKSITDANGNITTYSYDNRGNLIDLATSCCNTTYSYDSHGQMLSITNGLGNVTSYEYDTYGNRTKITDALGYDTVINYDGIGNVISETDANQNKTSYSYDALDRLISTTDGLGNTENYTYDAVGNRKNFTDKNGNETTYSYDALNRLISIKDCIGNMDKYTYDAVGNRKSFTDKNGNITTYIYNELNQLTGTTDALGKTANFTYDAVGNQTGIIDKNGNTTTYIYDVVNRLIAATDGLGYSENYTYDALGNQTSKMDRNGNTTTYSYNDLNRLTGITDGLGNTENYMYDAVGNRTGLTDKNGNTTTYSYDALNRLISTTDALGNTITYSYDPVGNVLSRLGADGNTWQYEYDAMKNCTKEITPLGNETLYSYDPVGNRLSRTDPNSLETNYQYDCLDRIIKVSYQNSERTDYEYDKAGNVLRMIHTGGLGDVTERTYDALNRLITETIDYGPFSKSVSYTYDGNGNILTLIDPDGKAINYEYDGERRQTRITDSFNNVTTKVYDPVGNETEIRFPDSTWKTLEYDNADRLTKITTRNKNDSLLFEYAYTYDGFGNALHITKNGLDQANFQYNGAMWLTHASYSTGQNIQYSYDPVGNRLTEENSGNITSYTYNTEGKISMQTFPDGGKIEYISDNNNHIIKTSSSWGDVTYDYDQENRLIGINYPWPYGTINNYYSPEGIRLARNERGNLIYYSPTILGIVTEMDDSGNTYVRINPDISFQKNNKTTCIHWDALGNTSDFTSSNIEASFQFDYFGSMLSHPENPDDVDQGLYTSLMKIDFVPQFGAEFADIDFMPSINQRFGGKFLNWKKVKRHKGLCDELIRSKRYYHVVCNILRPRYYNRLMNIPKVAMAVQAIKNCRHWMAFGLPKLALQIVICCPAPSKPGGKTPPKGPGLPSPWRCGSGMIRGMDCSKICYRVYQQFGRHQIDIKGLKGAVPVINGVPPQMQIFIAWTGYKNIHNTNYRGEFQCMGETLLRYKQPFWIDVWYQNPFTRTYLGPCKIY